MENYVTRASVWHHEAPLICHGFICGSNAGKMILFVLILV